MKRALSVVLQMIVYFAIYAAGCLLPGLHKLPEWTLTTASGRLFVLDGVILMAVLFVLILLTQAVRRRLQHAWGAPVLAFVLSLLLLAATRFPLALITPSANGL